MGSPMFLKRLYGCGYLLSFVLNGGDGSPRPGDRRIIEYVRSRLDSRKSAKISSNVGKEVIIEVDGDDNGFVSLMESLDDPTVLASIGAASFGISVPNIEEVFLKVTGGPISDGVDRENSAASSAAIVPAVVTADGRPKTTRKATFTQQFAALLERRVRYSIRDRYFFVMQLLFPFIILIVGLGFVKAGTDQTPKPLALKVAPLNPNFLAGNFWQIPAPAPGNIENYCKIGNTTTSSTECNLLIPPYTGVTNPYEFQSVLLHGIPPASPWTYSPNPFFGYANFAEPTTGSKMFGVWQNTTGLHTASLGVLGYFNSWSSQAGNVQMSIVNDPLPNTKWELQSINSITGLLATQIIMLAMRFIPTAVISFIVLEKEKEIKEQLFISGVSVRAYWLSHFVFDSIFSLLSALVAIACFFIYKLDIYVGDGNLAGSFALLLLYGPASTAFAYACSFLFSAQHTAQSFIAVSSLVLGNILMVLSYVLMLLPTDTCASCYNIGETVLWIGRLFPPFALGSGFYVLASYVDQFKVTLTSSQIFGGCKWGYYFTRFDCYAGIGDDLFFLGLMTIVYLVIAIGVDEIKSIPSWQKRFVVKSLVSTAGDTTELIPLEDEDVLAEKSRVDSLNASSEMLLVRRIQKIFRRAGTARTAFWAKVTGNEKKLESTTVHAVESVSFAADKGEVFGLLGSNGAGKTTTFKMLCGLYCPSNGDIYINGLDATKEMMKVRRIIGYCAQFDAQWDLLTTREHILLYAKLRGYEGAELRAIVEGKLNELNLREYEFVRSGALSGGNRRKLSVAMALVGEPELVFLDEPSCGMDPFARRNMWKIIESVADKRKHAIIILTTHSMEEAEALCSRIAIQVDGRFRCLGSSQEIKNRYGEGFQLSVRVLAKGKTVEAIRKEIAESLNLSDEISGQVSLKDWMDSELVTAVAGRRDRMIHPSFGLRNEGEILTVGELAIWVYKDTIFGDIESFLMNLYSSVELVELHGLNIVVKINGKVKIGELFKKLNQNKNKIGIQDYQVTQTTLEQIFNKFAATASNRED